jgi:hypothetical protein
MKTFAQLVAIVSTSAMLQGCLTLRSGEPPVSAGDEETVSAPAPEPARGPETAPAPPTDDRALRLTAETSQSSSGEFVVNGLNVEHNTIDILATRQISDYRLITLSDPARLVIDIPGAASAFPQKSLQIDKLGIATARFEIHPGFLRIFLDASQWRIIPYRVEEAKTGLKIIITTP